MNTRIDNQRDPLNSAIDRALAARITLQEIAIGSGVPYESLRQFRRKAQHLGEGHKKRLHAFCTKKGYFDLAPIGNEIALPDPASVSDAFEQAILRLRNAVVAATVSDLPKTAKAAILKKEMKIVQDDILPNVKD